MQQIAERSDSFPGLRSRNLAVEAPKRARVIALLSSKIIGDSLVAASALRDDLEVLGVHIAPQAALEACSDTSCHVLLTDLHLSTGSYQGLRLVSHIRHRFPHLRGIVLAKDESQRELVASFRAGARGYLVEGTADVDTMCKAICCVARGQVWASSRQLNWILDEFGGTAGPARMLEAVHRLLSCREAEVADLMMRGKTNKEIAAILHLSEHTVKNHLVKVFSKLGITTRAAAIYQMHERFQMTGSCAHCSAEESSGRFYDS